MTAAITVICFVVIGLLVVLYQRGKYEQRHPRRPPPAKPDPTDHRPDGRRTEDDDR
jgi:hypothetical protein